MSRNPLHRWPTAREITSEDRVEDRVKNFVAKMPHRAAVITSVRVAMQLANLWDVEKIAMDSRGDDPLVYHILDEERHWLASAAAESSRSPIWGSCPHEYVGRMFTVELSSDVAAFLAYRIARSICWKERF